MPATSRRKPRKKPPAPSIRPRTVALIGRDRALEDLEASVAARELVVIVGPGGVGKTRVLRALESRLDAAFVEAGPVRSAEALLRAVALTLGMVIRGDTDEELFRHLELAPGDRRTRVLLVDECENLEPSAMAMLARLHERVGSLVLTSRVRLHLRGEHVVPLPPLAFPTTDRLDEVRASPSVSLFFEKARAAGVTLERSAEVLRDVASIVRRLEGHPLALELAASHAAAIGLARARRDIERSLDGDTSTGTDVHASLRRALAHSLARLTDDARAVLEIAAVFATELDIGALEALAGPGATDAIRVLVDHSMLVARAPMERPTTLVLGTHAVIREAVLAACSPARREALDVLHARARAETARTLAADRSTAATLTIVGTELALTRAWSWALAHGSDREAAEIAVDIACAIGRLVETFGPAPSRLDMLDRTAALPRLPTLSRARRAELTFFRGLARLERSQLAEAETLYEEARTLAAGGHSPRYEAISWTQLAWLSARAGELAAADERLDHAERIAHAARDPWPEMVAAELRGQMAMRRQNLGEARRVLEHARGLAIRMGDGANDAGVSGFLGSVAYDEGQLREAVQHYDHAVRVASQLSAVMLEAIFRGYRATALHELGDPGAAAAYEEAIDLAARAHSPRFRGLFSAWQGALHAEHDRLEEAAAALDVADGAVEGPHAAAIVSLHRGHVDLARAARAERQRDVEGGGRHVARAIERLAQVSLSPESLRELRVAHRYLERRIVERLDPAPRADLVVGWNGAWYAHGEARVSLASERVLARLLFLLVVARLARPGTPVSFDSLVASVWPEQRVANASASHRLRVAISNLRRRGLRDGIDTIGDGYLIDPARAVALARR
jgi:predicted ATPase